MSVATPEDYADAEMYLMKSSDKPVKDARNILPTSNRKLLAGLRNDKRPAIAVLIVRT